MRNHTQITARTIPEAHKKAVYNIWNFGNEVLDERGDLIRELLDLKIIIPTDDISHCGAGLTEKQETDFAEGLIDPEKAKQKGEDFDYAYGERLWTLNQLNKTVERLIKNPMTRRAVLPLFDKIDNCMTVNEVPCWCLGQFILRDNKLNAEIYFRSNDLYGAFPADCYGIRKLQEWTVKQINKHRRITGEPIISIGYYSHTICSAHVRMTDEDAIKVFLNI